MFTIWRALREAFDAAIVDKDYLKGCYYFLQVIAAFIFIIIALLVYMILS